MNISPKTVHMGWRNSESHHSTKCPQRTVYRMHDEVSSLNLALKYIRLS